MSKLSEQILAEIPDATIEQAVRAGADNAGVKFSGSDIATIVEAIKQALRNMCEECEAEADSDYEMRSRIRREVQRFWRQIGGRFPNGAHQIL
jgi:hypothetical protein